MAPEPLEIATSSAPRYRLTSTNTTNDAEVTAAASSPSQTPAVTFAPLLDSSLVGAPPLGSRPLSPRLSRRESAAPEKATAAFIRRILCGHHVSLPTGYTGKDGGISVHLPPLTSSNDIDLELYALLASLVRDYIQPWYGKITPDRAFLDELILVVAHVCRAVEGRARKVDWTLLLLDTIPNVVLAHVEAYRTAHAASSASGPALDSARLHTIYKVLRPHPAFADAESDRSYRNALASGLLLHLLPHDDAENPCLQTFAEALLADLLFGSVLSRVCEPLFVLTAIKRAADSAQPRTGIEPWATRHTVSDSGAADGRNHISGTAVTLAASSRGQQPGNRLAQYGLVQNDSLVSSSTPFTKTTRAPEVLAPASPNPLDTVFTLLSHLALALSTLFSLLTALLSAPSLPSRFANSTHPQPPSVLKPLYDYTMTTLLLRLFHLPTRLPWLPFVIRLVQRISSSTTITTTTIGPLPPPLSPLSLFGPDARIDRLLAHHLLTPARSPELLPALLKALRTAIFPAPTTTSSPTQTHTATANVTSTLTQARHTAALAVLNCLPRQAAVLLLGLEDGSQLGAQAQAPEIETAAAGSSGADADAALAQRLAVTALDPFAADAELTRALAYGVLEAVVLAVVPEMRRAP